MALIKPIYPVPLINKIKALLAFKLPNEEMPPPPITYVDDNVCKLSNNSIKARNMGLIPLLLMVLFTVYLNVDDFYTGWDKKEKSVQNKIKFYKKELGNNYFISPGIPEVRKMWFEMLDENGDLSLSNYMHYRYYTTAKVGGTYRLKKDISFLVFYAISIPLLLFFIIRFKRQAPMIFDRDKQIVYLWYKGKVRAQHFKDLRVYEDFQMMRIQIRGFDKHNDMQWANFRVQPRHNAYYSGSDAYEPVLAFICQFMEYGREHVMPQHEQWQTLCIF